MDIYDLRMAFNSKVLSAVTVQNYICKIISQLVLTAGEGKWLKYMDAIYLEFYSSFVDRILLL